MQIETQELALFRSVHDALKFACNYRHGQLKAPGMATLYQTPPGLGNDPPKPPSRGLGGLDGAAQAGIIGAEIKALEPKIRGQIIIARFTVKAIVCDCQNLCCSGFRPNVAWFKAISEIAELARTEALAGTVVNFHLRHLMVRKYFGVHVSFLGAAKTAGVDRDTASAHGSKVVTWLKDHERKAIFAIEGRLKQAGIVE